MSNLSNPDEGLFVSSSICSKVRFFSKSFFLNLSSLRFSSCSFNFFSRSNFSSHSLILIYSSCFFLSSSSFNNLSSLSFFLCSFNCFCFNSSSLTLRSISFLLCSSSFNFNSFSFPLISLAS